MKIISERHATEKMLSLLSQNNMDMDLFEELARETMHLSYSDEIIILSSEQEKADLEGI